MGGPGLLGVLEVQQVQRPQSGGPQSPLGLSGGLEAKNLVEAIGALEAI